MRESTIQKKIITYLNSIGVWSVKTITTNKPGTPDIIACVDGVFVAFEVKTNKGVVSPLQNYQIREIQKANGAAFVVRSVDEVQQCLSSLN